MPVTCTCEICGATFQRKPSEIGKYCSKSCRGRAFGGEKSCHWKGGLATYTCANPACGKSFQRPPSQAIDHELRYCSHACFAAHLRGPNSPNWKGGRTWSGGYFKIYAPDHPNAAKDGYIGEHVLVVAGKIGRSLRPGECVHHVDGDPTNNDPANLVVLTASEHTTLHHKQGDIHRNKLK